MFFFLISLCEIDRLLSEKKAIELLYFKKRYSDLVEFYKKDLQKCIHAFFDKYINLQWFELFELFF